MSIIAFLNTFEKQPEKWGFTYGDTLQFVLLKSNGNFQVKSLYNDLPLDLDSTSVQGVMPAKDWMNLMISKMYYGSLSELQTSPWAERPESHIKRDSATWETNFQWYFKQV